MDPRVVPAGQDVYAVALQHRRQNRLGDHGVCGIYHAAVHHVRVTKGTWYR
jgi:hypothetical protein